jgi:hypothetical protein
MVTVPVHTLDGVGTTMPVIEPPPTLATEVTDPEPVQVVFQEYVQLLVDGAVPA